MSIADNKEKSNHYSIDLELASGILDVYNVIARVLEPHESIWNNHLILATSIALT